jgi:hypothetical protein
MKEGPSLSSRAQGGVLCAPKNKKTKYYEIRIQGETKLSSSFFENKLKFNLKKREFTRSLPSLSLLSRLIPPTAQSMASPSISNIELLASSPNIELLASSLQRPTISIVSSSYLSVTFLFPSVWNFKFLKRSSTFDRCRSIAFNSVAVDSITSCGQVSSFCNCQTTNNDDVITFRLKSAGWDATFSALPSRTQKSRGDNCRVAEAKQSNYFVILQYILSRVFFVDPSPDVGHDCWPSSEARHPSSLFSNALQTFNSP